MVKLKEIKINGIPMIVIDYTLDYDEQILLMKIRESERRENIGGIVHEPGNPIMSDIPIDEEFSKVCCENLF